MTEPVPKSESPLVSVIVLYYQRPETIQEVLGSVVAQDYANWELIVVDNHSQDSLPSIVEKLGVEAQLVKLNRNVGACAGRNAGIRVARGRILVCLDDDVSLATPTELSKIVRTFRVRPDIHVLAFQVCDPKTGEVRAREWCHTRPLEQFADEEFETNWFGEGGSAIRREVFETCGTYYEPLFYGAEGHDLIVRVLNHGFRILHTPDIRVKHWAHEKGSMLPRQQYYFTRNYIWMAYKDYRLWDGLCFVLPKLAMLLYFAWRSSTYGPFLRGLAAGAAGLPRVHCDRSAISKRTIRYLRELDKWRPGLKVRIARHKERPLI